MTIIVDPEFRDKIPPLSTDEFSKLEENILADGEVREPLVLWHNTIIDGHHRWQIIQKHPGLPYKVKHMEFNDKWSAIVWMCRNQLGRRNLTDAQKTYLVGKQYEAERMALGGDRKSGDLEKSNDQIDHLIPGETTRQRIARETGTSEGFVRNAELFARGVEEGEKASPGFKESVLSGGVKASKRAISEIRKMPEEERREAVEAIRRGEKVYLEYTPVKNATPVEPRPAYNLDDFREELMAVVVSFDRSLKTTLVLAHREMLDNQAGQDIAEEVFESAGAVLTKYKKMVEEVAKDAKSV